MANKGKKKLSKYNIFQQELSRYIKKTGKVYPGKFHELSKELYPKIINENSRKAIKGRINEIYLEHFTKSQIQAEEFKNDTDFPFYDAEDNFDLPRYAKKTFNVYFYDGEERYEIENATRDEFLDWYKNESGFFQYLRREYNLHSPHPYFSLLKGDDKEVFYNVVVETSQEKEEKVDFKKEIKKDISASKEKSQLDIELELQNKKLQEQLSKERTARVEAITELYKAKAISAEDFKRMYDELK